MVGHQVTFGLAALQPSQQAVLTHVASVMVLPSAGALMMTASWETSRFWVIKRAFSVADSVITTIPTIPSVSFASGVTAISAGRITPAASVMALPSAGE